MSYITFQPSDYFNTKLWSGDDTSPRSLTGVGFQPDWTIIKKRSTAGSHVVFDAVRTAGSTKGLATNSTAQEGLTATEGTTAVYGYVSSFDSDGFTVTAGTGAGANSDAYVNNTSDNYVAWNWKANGAGSSNTDGSVTSTVSANTTAGFSIVKWTANLSSAVTVGHGLGTTPKVIIMKAIDQTSGWVVGGFGLDWSGYLLLEGTNAFSNDSNDSTGSGRFFSPGGTEPTSSVFSTNSAALTGSATDVIAYCFAEKKGFSKFGTYTGNGSTDGPMVYTGFKPAFVITKQTNTTGFWTLKDNKRPSDQNPNDTNIYPNSTDAEATSANDVDFLSNGFRIRNTGSYQNTSGGTYLYLAFASEPLVSSNDIPATAR